MDISSIEKELKKLTRPPRNSDVMEYINRTTK
jgi:hypothetical protein